MACQRRSYVRRLKNTAFDSFLDSISLRLLETTSSDRKRVARFPGPIRTDGLSAPVLRQALEEHGVRLFPRFDIIETVRNNLFRSEKGSPFPRPNPNGWPVSAGLTSGA